MFEWNPSDDIPEHLLETVAAATEASRRRTAMDPVKYAALVTPSLLALARDDGERVPSSQRRSNTTGK